MTGTSSVSLHSPPTLRGVNPIYMCICVYIYNERGRERDLNITREGEIDLLLFILQGTLVANDWNKQRIAALAANLARQGVRCAITLQADGREFPKLMGGT